MADYRLKSANRAAGVVLVVAMVAGLAIWAIDNADAQYKNKGKLMKTGLITVNGTLSDKGVECPGMMGDDGRFYTLVNVDRSKMMAGRRIQVSGTIRQITKCMQGQTIVVKTITDLK